MSAAADVDTTTNTPEELLPSYEAAVGFLDTTKLPSYRRNFSARFHPYGRPSLKIIDERDRFLNTIFDDECILLGILDTTRRRVLPGPLQMIDDAEATQHLSDIELAIQPETLARTAT